MDNEQGFWALAATILGQFALQVMHARNDAKRNADVKELKAAIARLRAKLRKQAS